MIATDVELRLPRHRPRVALSVLVVAWGAQAIVTQSLLLREALVLMFGSEFAWGVVLFAWLFGVSVGALLGGRAARRRRADAWLAGVLLALGLAACVELWVFRGARAWLGVAPGELLPLSKTAVAALVFVSPVGALVGMAFPLACRLAEESADGEPRLAACAAPRGMKPTARGAGPLGNVYAMESAGSLIGGAAFSFWAVEHLAPIETALVCGALTAAASGALLAVNGRWRFGAAVLFGIAAAAFLMALFGGEALDRRLVERRWRNVAPGYTLCDEAESKYQNLAVGQRAEQFSLYCDGRLVADFPDPYTFVPPAHFWMCQHPAPRRVLVLGGGAEGLLAEILRHPIDGVDYVEPDPRLMEIIEPFLADADRRAVRDRRVNVRHQDARYFLKTQRACFDLVIARLPEPLSALRARFYTDEFYRELRRAMTPRSVVCMTVAAAPGELSPASGTYLASVLAGLRRHFPHVVVGWGDPAHVLAATEAGLVTTDPAELVARYTRRGVESEMFHPAWFEGATDWLEPEKLRRRADELDAVQQVRISTDLRPVAYVQRLVLWESAIGGTTGIIERLRSISLFGMCVGLGLLGGATVVACRLRRRSAPGWADGAIALSIGTTGFATMALSIVWLFAFQSLYGYVYQRIGWIIAVFMGGLVIGCRLAGRLSKGADDAGGSPSHLWRLLVTVDVLLAVLALAIPFILPALAAVQGTRVAFVLVEWAVLIMVALTGVLGGAAFALAGALQLSRAGEAAAAAGRINAADHAGACLGALLTGVVLVPVFGTIVTALLLGAVKLASASLLMVLGHPRRAAS